MTDWDAHDYVAHSAAQQVWTRELIAKLRLRGDEVVLDIGCGDGRATALIAERLPKGSVLGVDKAASMIALATEQFPPAAHPNLSFWQMDATRLELPRAFDVAFSSAALHWVDDHEAMLRGVRGCLRPGGRLLFQMGGRGNAAGAVAVVGEVVARAKLLTKDMQHADREAFLGWLRTTWFPTSTACRRSYATPFSTTWPPPTSPHVRPTTRA
jgi:trans-aconitate 2-methyltransferase